MKNCQKILSFFLILLITAFLTFAQEKSLADIYKTGKVKFIKELVLSDESLPEGEFFNSIIDVVTDNNGFIYVCDYRANNIRKFNAKGEFMKVIGKEGQGPGDFNRPSRVEIIQDRLVVWESRNLRISILNLNGDFIKSIPHDFRQHGWPYKMRALRDEKIILETEKSYPGDPKRAQERILRLYSQDMKYQKAIYEHEVLRNRYITEPVRINVPIPFSANVYWDVSPKGKIIIGFSEKYEIEIHDPLKGKTVSFDHKYEPVEVTKKDKEIYFAGMTTSFTDGTTEQIKRGAPDYIVENTEFPKYKPAFDDILCDSEGNIWVHSYCKDPKEQSRSFDVFDEGGRFINRVKIEGEGYYPRRVKIKKGAFWRVETDKDGFYRVVKYRISE